MRRTVARICPGDGRWDRDGSKESDRLVGVSNGLAVTDTSSPDYGSMCNVFTFSQPSAQIQIGTILDSMSGAIAKFNGMTQLANPVLIRRRRSGLIWCRPR